MFKPKYVVKNIELSEKLADYIADNPQVVKDHPDSASYVVFSAEDGKLNKVNEGLVRSLREEGTLVIKAEKMKSRKEPWKFIV